MACSSWGRNGFFLQGKNHFYSHAYSWELPHSSRLSNTCGSGCGRPEAGGSQSLPWPLLFLLSSRSWKHLLLSCFSLNKPNFLEAVQSFQQPAAHGKRELTGLLEHFTPYILGKDISSSPHHIRGCFLSAGEFLEVEQSLVSTSGDFTP